jgi:uncharacterized membrane protein YfcA
VVTLGLFATLAAGVVLGLVGGGGSLLIVPTFVYVFRHRPVDATAESLVVVAVAALAGAVVHARHHPVALAPAAAFAIPSVVAAYVARALIVPRLPGSFMAGPLAVRLDDVLMTGFALLAATAGVAMLRTTCCPGGPRRAPATAPLAGAATGALTALLGAGGGFAVVPALVLLVGLPMADAVGVSLGIVAAQATAGAAGALVAGVSFDLGFVATVTTVMLAGVVLGARGARHLHPDALRRGFAWLILAVATAIGVSAVNPFR